ncbi:hypothetical protein EON63_19145, partial [archaeon]
MNVPYGAVMVSVNESVKTMLNPSGAFSTQTSMIAGAIAGECTLTVFNPNSHLHTHTPYTYVCTLLIPIHVHIHIPIF